MSLITLTFGSKKNNLPTESSTGLSVSSPEDRLRQKILRTNATGKAIIKKACRFYSREEVFVLAEVVEGLVSQDMKIFFGDKQLEVIDLESKYGRAAKQGMIIGITLKNIDEDELLSGSELNFRLANVNQLPQIN
ncbi:MAG: hypothetical protein QXZ13_01360 [Candidatus Diapherotrites archaeon]